MQDATQAQRIGHAAYRHWRKTELGSITEALEHSLVVQLLGDVRNQHVLDVGCGDGVLSMKLAEAGAKVVGLDADPAMLVAARGASGALTGQPRFIEGRAERLPFPSDSFDAVIAVTVLCFLPEPERAIAEMARVLRPGGRLAIGELGRWSWWAAVRRIKAWLEPSLWRSAKFRTARQLRRLLEDAGLQVEEVRGAVFYPPSATCARLVAPMDARLGRQTTVGAAFVAVAAVKRSS